jgi:hypothetical protein
MRLGWAILISPAQSYVQQHIILLLGCVELLRRSMWAIFRVEWEWIKIQKKKSVDTVGILNLQPPDRVSASHPKERGEIGSEQQQQQQPKSYQR